jgi:RNA polymerase sigma factor (sigma-70 family)
MTRRGRAEDPGETSSGSPVWARLFEQFFSADPHEAAPAAATFARMIRFWTVRLGVRDAELSSDDLVQDVLLELTRSRAQIVDAGALGGWLRTTTVRKVQDRWRAAQRSARRENGTPLEYMPTPALLPEEHVLRKQDHGDLLEAIERLPPLLRECVRLQLRGLSETEIAERLTAAHPDTGPVRRHSVKNWLRKARGELRSALLDEHS